MGIGVTTGKGIGQEPARFRTPGARSFAAGVARYDRDQRWAWLGSKRLHHGLTGALLAGTGVAGMAAQRLSPLGGLPCALSDRVGLTGLENQCP
jgi:hypothetical protein